jgi:hypothetical protein
MKRIALFIVGFFALLLVLMLLILSVPGSPS